MSKLIKFTAPDDSPVWLVDAWVTKVIRNTDAVNNTQVPTCIWYSGGVQQVKESVTQVAALLQLSLDGTMLPEEER